MITVRQTPRYRIERDRCGFYLLTRLSDGYTAFFQGDDALEWSNTLDAIDLAPEHKVDEIFNLVCGEYDCIMQP